MAFPKKNSLTFKLCELIYKQGDMTVYELRVLASSVGCNQFHSPSYMVKEYVIRSGDTMTLKHLVRKHFDELTGGNSCVGSLPMPRTFEFKPWSGKHNLPTGRIDTSRSYITLSSGVPASTIPWRP